VEDIKAFFDTNILAYAFSSSNPEKQRTSLDLLKKSKRVISTQVIKELSNFFINKADFELSFIRSKISDIMNIVEITEEDNSLIFSAYNIHEIYGFSFYDCLIVAAALKSKATILYTEDMQHNQLINNTLKIVNPFI